MGEVTWIADGDTIDVDTNDGDVTVRLVATNAPERGECYADEAHDHLIDALSGTTVRLEVLGVDQFDRALAHVFVGDRHMNLEMVELGLALASTPDEGDPYGAVVLGAEESAFADRTGLWSPDACGGHGDVAALSIGVASSRPDPVGPDEENLDAELIAIRNDGDVVVDLEGWTLRDESSRHRFRFGAGATIAPGEVLSVSSDAPGWTPGGSPVWNNGGDMALLQDPDGVVVARWRY